MSPIDSFKKMSSTLKTMIIGTTGVIAFVTAVWAVDDRYVDQQEVVQTLEQYDAKVQRELTGIKNNQKIEKFNQITDRYYQKKDLVRKYPEDTELKAELAELRNARARMAGELGVQ